MWSIFRFLDNIIGSLVLKDIFYCGYRDFSKYRICCRKVQELDFVVEKVVTCRV